MAQGKSTVKILLHRERKALEEVNFNLDDREQFFALRQRVESGREEIVSLRVDNGIQDAKIDLNFDGYCIINKLVFHDILWPSGQESLLGLGCWRQGESIVRVRWHDRDSLELVDTEAKPLKECLFFMIFNNGKDRPKDTEI